MAVVLLLGCAGMPGAAPSAQPLAHADPGEPPQVEPPLVEPAEDPELALAFGDVLPEDTICKGDADCAILCLDGFDCCPSYCTPCDVAVRADRVETVRERNAKRCALVDVQCPSPGNCASPEHHFQPVCEIGHCNKRRAQGPGPGLAVGPAAPSVKRLVVQATRKETSRDSHATDEVFVLDGEQIRFSITPSGAHAHRRQSVSSSSRADDNDRRAIDRLLAETGVLGLPPHTDDQQPNPGTTYKISITYDGAPGPSAWSSRGPLGERSDPSGFATSDAYRAATALMSGLKGIASDNDPGSF
jgi:hypothetical protein